MNPISARRVARLGAMVVLLVLPATASAQYRLPALIASAKADSLHEAASRMVAAHRWRDAARLHRESAKLRAPEDPLGFRCLSEAGAIAYALRDRSAARSDMADAAAHALARGDLRAAALAYLDAAWIAQEQNRPRLVWEHGHRAEMLAASPLLAPVDRLAIVQRISRAPESMQLAMRQAP
jgi:hypothetical protein